jgi:alkylation response protein AidB-like acyl-CoA dehydrogenase
MMLNVLGRLRDNLTWPREVYAEVCREIAAHGGGVNTCATEADLGSVSRGGVPAATAAAADGGWRINGKKSFVTGAPGRRIQPHARSHIGAPLPRCTRRIVSTAAGRSNARARWPQRARRGASGVDNGRLTTGEQAA